MFFCATSAVQRWIVDIGNLLFLIVNHYSNWIDCIIKTFWRSLYIYIYKRLHIFNKARKKCLKCKKKKSNSEILLQIKITIFRLNMFDWLIIITVENRCAASYFFCGNHDAFLRILWWKFTRTAFIWKGNL